VDQIKSQLDTLTELADEQVAELQSSIISQFEAVEGEEPTPETVDAMTSLADALDTVRGELSRREVLAAELAAKAAEATARVKGEDDVQTDGEAMTDNSETPEAPMEEAPMEEVPMDAPVEEAPVEEVPAEEMPAEEVPAEGSPEEEAGETPVEEDEEKKKEASEYSAETETASIIEGDGSELSTESTPEVVADAAPSEPTHQETIAPNEQEGQAPVTAAAEESFNAPADRQPVIQVTEAPVAITAGADIPGYTAGSTINDMTEVAAAMEKRIHSLRRVNGGDGEQHIVASITTHYPEERILSTDALSNQAKINAVVGQDALVASGGHAAPFEVKYDIYNIGSTTDRPVRDMLPRFQADRGGIRFVTPPKFAGATYDSAVGIWTAGIDQYGANGLTALSLSATAISGSSGAWVIGVTSNTIPVGAKVTFGTVGTATTLSNVTANVTASTSTTITIDSTAALSGTPSSGTVSPVTVKGSYTVVSAAENTVSTDAITLQLQFGNLMTRAYPELIARHNELALVQHAREAEQNLLSKIGTASTSVVTSSTIGLGRDFLVQVRRAAVAYRSRHRISPSTQLKAIVPLWLYDAMAADLTLALPGDGTISVSAAEIQGYLAASNVTLVGSPDLNSFGAQSGSGASINAFPATFDWYLFAEGSFLFLDGGTLDLGIIRDSSLVGTNDYKMFLETFENIAFVGIESLKITSTYKVNGVTAAAATAVAYTA